MAAIDSTPEYVAHLLSMTHRSNELISKGYVLKPLSPAQLLKKARCDRCNKRPSKSKPWKLKANPKKLSPKDSLTAVIHGTTSLDASGDRTTASPSSAAAELPRGQKIQGKCFNCDDVGHKAADCPKERRALPNMEQKPPKPPCQWHPGARRGAIYLCCRAHVSTPGCRSAPTHSLPKKLSPALTTRFQVQTTPPATLPKAVAVAVAVAIDCEMGIAFDGEPELIRVTVLDYFTGAVLLDSLVWPDIPMQHFNTRYSGVTAPQMRAAKHDRTCLFGVEAARREVWRYVDADTVVVGHDVKNDLGALRWAHGLLVDSLLVEAAAREKASLWDIAQEKENRNVGASSVGFVGGVDRAASQEGKKELKAPGLSLKDVSKLRLGRIIQNRTHDSFEDALASRDIVHHHAMISMAKNKLSSYQTA